MCGGVQYEARRLTELMPSARRL